MPFITQAVVVLYLCFLLLSVFIPSWKANSSAEYISAGRKLTLFPFVATLVTTMYGWINGIGQLYAEYGVSAWLFLSLPYSLFAVVFAFWYAAKARNSSFQTLPDLLDFHYGKKVAGLGALLIVVFTAPAMYLLMTMQILHFIWPVNKIVLIVIVTTISTLYILRGGLKAVVKSDVIQFVLMFGGFVLVLYQLYATYGTAPLHSLPEDKTAFSSGPSGWYVGSWFLFAAVVLIDPNYYQRVYSAQSVATAKYGLLLSVLCWTIFDFLAATTALYAIHILPADVDTSSIYLSLGSLALSPLAAGIFFTAILATVISTANGFLFTSSISISKDLLQRNGWFSSQTIEQLTPKVILFVAFVNAAVCVVYRNNTAVDLFFDLAPYAVSALLLPVLLSYTRFKLSGRAVLVQSLLSLAGAFLANVYTIQYYGAQFTYAVVYIGLTISLLCHIVLYHIGPRT